MNKINSNAIVLELLGSELSIFVGSIACQKLIDSVEEYRGRHLRSKTKQKACDNILEHYATFMIFRAITTRLLADGRSYVSARFVVEIMRHAKQVGGWNTEWRSPLDNQMPTPLARILEIYDPSFKGVFRKIKRKGQPELKSV